MARVSYLQKDKLNEQKYESEATLAYKKVAVIYIGDGEITNCPKIHADDFSVSNLKTLKLNFNRIYRLKISEPKEAASQYETLLEAVD
jgi:hypothetical protein